MSQNIRVESLFKMKMKVIKVKNNKPFIQPFFSSIVRTFIQLLLELTNDKLLYCIK